MSRILANAQKTAERLDKSGLISKVTLKEISDICIPEKSICSPSEIRALRERHGVSQALLARLLNTKTVTVSAWEQGCQSPGGASLRLLDIINRKGIEVLC
jgi:putative transcriptional regulator